MFKGNSNALDEGIDGLFQGVINLLSKVNFCSWIKIFEPEQMITEEIIEVLFQNKFKFSISPTERITIINVTFFFAMFPKLSFIEGILCSWEWNKCLGYLCLLQERTYLNCFVSVFLTHVLFVHRKTVTWVLLKFFLIFLHYWTDWDILRPIYATVLPYKSKMSMKYWNSTGKICSIMLTTTIWDRICPKDSKPPKKPHP